MIHVSAKDALQALKKFKRLAKQDLLASQLTAEPDFWRRQAEARRTTYDVLMRLVENEGVEAAHRYAVEELAALPLLGSDEQAPPNGGKRQALQMFFSLLGLEHQPAEQLAVEHTAVEHRASAETRLISDLNPDLDDDEPPLRLKASS